MYFIHLLMYDCLLCSIRNSPRVCNAEKLKNLRILVILAFCKGQTNYQHKEVFISQPFGAVASLFCIILL